MNLPTPLVLVFDRDADTRAWYRAAFVSTDYRVAEASDGTVAVEVMAGRLPDLVITEVRSGHQDGLTLCVIKRSNAATADIPLLMVTLDHDPDVQAAAGFVGASELLEKPPTPTEVLAVAARLIVTQTRPQLIRRQLHRILADLRDAGGAQDIAAVDFEQQRSRLLARMASTDSGVVLADDRGHFVAANAAACALTGYSDGELLARSVLDLVPAGREGHVRLLWARFLVNRECDGVFEMVRKEGARVVIQLCAQSNVAPGLHATAVASQ